VTEQKAEIQLNKLQEEAVKKEEDYQNNPKWNNSSINLVNVSKIIDIMRTLIPVNKDYKNNLIILAHLLNLSILLLSAVSVALVIILLFLHYHSPESRPCVKKISIVMLILAVITN
jgi:type IV secretory pathway TrbL component